MTDEQFCQARGISVGGKADIAAPAPAAEPVAKRARTEAEAAPTANKDASTTNSQPTNPKTTAPAAAAAEAPTQIRCCICRERPSAPFQSPCGHIACFLCWQESLAVALQCPSCYERTRMRQLTKVYFL